MMKRGLSVLEKNVEMEALWPKGSIGVMVRKRFLPMINLTWREVIAPGNERKLEEQHESVGLSPGARRQGDKMIPAVIERCAGIDVGRRFVVVCVMAGEAQATPAQEVRKFSTLNEGLRQLRDWLRQNDCTHVVMESTGSYWRPIYNVLDDGQLQVILANSQQVKNLRGHKTDPNDARWLAHLLRHGMIRPSFIPDRDTRELRDLTRRRKQLIGCAVDERNRVQRVLREANVQLGVVLSDIFGESGLNMLDALVNEAASPEQIADLAVRTARKKIPRIQKALEGHQMTDHHRSLVRHSMRHLAFLEDQIAELDREIATCVNASRNLKTAADLLESIPGIKQTSAAAIVAETGADMSQFPTGGQLASWIGVCPGNHESAGKRKSGRTTQGNPWARRTLVECAWSGSRKKESATQNRYERLKPKIKHKRALVATAHWMVLKIHEVLSTGQPYATDPHPDLTAAQARRLLRHHSRRLTHLHKWFRDRTDNRA
jgi:transposase